MKKKAKKIKAISAEQFDKYFDEGRDMTPYVDFSKAKFQPPMIQRVNLDMPVEMLKKADKEANRVGVTRTSLFKIWIAERLDQLKKH